MVNNISAGREVVIALEASFAGLLAGLTAFVQSLPAELLYRNPNPAVLTVATVGENVLKCAAILEQVFGGLTANLWDDPFEWTLPETLDTRQRIVEYLEEVEATRKRAFEGFSTDTELLKKVAVPSGELQTLLSIILDTLVRAVDYQGRAITTLEILPK